jgi:hypothetical protein
MSGKLKVLLYQHAYFAEYRTDFTGTYCKEGIVTKDTIIEVFDIEYSPNISDNDRRDMIIIEKRVCDGGKYLMVMPGSYEIKE